MLNFFDIFSMNSMVILHFSCRGFFYKSVQLTPTNSLPCEFLDKKSLVQCSLLLFPFSHSLAVFGIGEP